MISFSTGLEDSRALIKYSRPIQPMAPALYRNSHVGIYRVTNTHSQLPCISINSQSVPFSVVMHELRTQTSPAWLNRRAKPGSEIKCGRPSDPQRRPSLAYLAKRVSVLAMEASRARAGADPGSYYCVHIQRISARGDKVVSTYVAFGDRRYPR